MRVTITVPPDQPWQPQVLLEFAAGQRDYLDLAFMTAWAGHDRLDRRMNGLVATDVKGRPLRVEEIGSGHWRVAGPLSGRIALQYSMTLAPTWPVTDWRTFHNTSAQWADFGYLSGWDLFPEIAGVEKQVAEVLFVLPPGWTVAGLRYDMPVQELRGYAWAAGRIRVHRPGGDAAPAGIVTHGEFPWPEASVIKIATCLIGHIRRRFCHLDEALLILARYPGEQAQAASIGGCAHGSTLYQLTGSPPGGGGQPPLRWGRHLAHEMIHLVLPGQVPMGADLTWFCEGGAEYLSAKMLRQYRIMTEAEYGQLLDSWRTDAQRLSGPGAVSLAEACAHKFTDMGRDLIYRRGAYVMHLLDREIQLITGGRVDLEAVVSSIGAAHAERMIPFAAADVVRLLGGWGDFQPFFNRFVSGTESPE